MINGNRGSVAAQSHPQTRHLLHLFWIAVLLQAGASIAAYKLWDIPVSTEIDSVEYIRTADNVRAGRGFSIDLTAPWKPTGFRTPGPLLLNIPMLALSFGNDVVALIISRLVLLTAAVSVVYLALQLGLASFGFLAGSFFVVMPSIAYYSLLPYSTELPYAAACGLLFTASLAYMNAGTWKALALIGLAAMYALYLRPAALFALSSYVLVAIVIASRTRFETSRRILLSAGSCFLGVVIAYASWSYRNYNVFGSFQYSTVSGYNLLHFNARGMEPYLDENGKQELQIALAKYPTFLQRYDGYDQFILSNHQAKEGLRLIFKYPLPFLRSHLAGVMQSFFLFSPSSLKNRSSIIMLAASFVHTAYAVIGILGLAAFWKTFSELQRFALLLILTVGVVSTLTGGALLSPRFRIPLDIPLSLGCALFVMRASRKEIIQYDYGKR